MILHKIISGFLPQAAVVHLVARDGPPLVQVWVWLFEALIQTVEASHAHLIEVSISLHAKLTVHGIAVVACGHAIPGLPGVLIVAHILVAQLEVVAQPGKSAVVAARVAAGAVQIAVGAGVVVGSVEDEMVADEAGGEVAAHIIGVVGAVRPGDLERRLVVGHGRGQRDGAAEGTVAIG